MRRKLNETVQLSIIGLTYSQIKNNAYALLLGEEEGSRRLPIVIGAFEAQSIAIALEKDILPPRPLTHDLFTSFALTFNIYLKSDDSQIRRGYFLFISCL